MIYFSPHWMDIAKGELGTTEDTWSYNPAGPRSSHDFNPAAYAATRYVDKTSFATYGALVPNATPSAAGRSVPGRTIHTTTYVNRATGTLSQSNPAVSKYFEAIPWIGKPDVPVPDDVPWCAAFVNWCLARAGYRGTGSTQAKSFLEYGIRLHGPMYGAITVVNRPGGKHVAFCNSRAGDQKLKLLGGNQSNSVCESDYTKVRKSASFHWPLGAVGDAPAGRAGTQLA